MRAIIDNFDHIARLTIKGGTDIGLIPGGVGLQQLRWNGSAIVNLSDLSAIHVRRFDGRWYLHSITVPGSQLVTMTWSQRKRIYDDAGTYKVYNDSEWEEQINNYVDDVKDNQGLKQQLTDLVANTSYADLETKVNIIFADHTGAQRTFLLQLSRVVLYLAKKELT